MLANSISGRACDDDQLANTIVMTGATGLVGGGLLQRVLETHPEAIVWAVARNPERLPVHPRVHPLRADISAERIPLNGQTADVRAIYHCAADIRFGLPLEKARAVNVGGTERLMELARRCPRLEKFVHVSTVFVAGGSAGDLPEAPLQSPPSFFNTYQQTKWEAEQAVLNKPDLPALTVRLSTIISDSRGLVRQRNYFHQLLALIPRNPLECIAADSAAPIDLIPSDWAVESLFRLAEESFEPGAIRHVCAGPSGTVPFGELLERAYELYGRPARKPVLVTPEQFKRYTKTLNAGARELVRVLGYFLPHLCVRQVFHRSGRWSPPCLRGYYDGVVRSVLGLETC